MRMQVTVLKEGTVAPIQVVCPQCGTVTRTTLEQLSTNKGEKTCEGCRALLGVEVEE